jgi:hypothetical protein
MKVLIHKALQQYNIRVASAEPIDADGDVFIVNTVDGEKYFIKIINESTGTDRECLNFRVIGNNIQ